MVARRLRVSRAVAADPVRASVVGVGRPVNVRPPAAVISRTVVAVRTPPPPQRPIEQRQAQSGGHLNEQALVHPVAPSRPAQSERTPQTQQGFRPFNQPNGGNNNNQVRTMPNTQPRTFEEQGNAQPENRDVQPGFRTPAPSENQHPGSLHRS